VSINWRQEVCRGLVLRYVRAREMLETEDFIEGRVFVSRIYFPRVLGSVLCGFVILITTYSDLTKVLLVLLGLNALVWAHIARYIAFYSSDPFRSEKNNLLVDSLLCGFWIAVMHAKPIPTALIFAMVAMNNISVGGPVFWIKGLVCKLSGFFIAFLAFGFSYKGASEFDDWVCVPLAVIYPMILGLAFYSLASEFRSNKKQLRELSRIDPLTGLLNRRYWSEMVSACLKRKSKKENSVLAIIDIDGFKGVNDSCGHTAGDNILRTLSKVLTEKLRVFDYICRYGGDEFCVLLTNVNASDAEARMREICEAFRCECDAIFPDGGLTLSVGIVPWNIHISEVDCWISLADKNLYAAKRGGKNQVVCGKARAGKEI